MARKNKSKNFTARFTTKMGMTAAPDKKFKSENFAHAAQLADHVFRNETKNLFDAYTYSIETPAGDVFHYSASHGKRI